jgi:hypothetical protein
MEHQVSIVDQPDIELIVCRADEFPAGIKDSWEKLESKLYSLKGRKFYVLTFFEDRQLVYYAGLQPLNETRIYFSRLTDNGIEGWQICPRQAFGLEQTCR